MPFGNNTEDLTRSISSNLDPIQGKENKNIHLDFNSIAKKSPRNKIFLLSKQQSMPDLKSKLSLFTSRTPRDENSNEDNKLIPASFQTLSWAIDGQWEKVKYQLRNHSIFINRYCTADFCKEHNHALIYDGYTLLHLAVWDNKCDRETLELLIEKGANINAFSGNGKKTQPIHIASFKGNLRAVQILVEKGAHCDFALSSDGTPLHIALREGHSDIALYLINQFTFSLILVPDRFFNKNKTILCTLKKTKQQTLLELAFQSAVSIECEINCNNRVDNSLHWEVLRSLLQKPEVKLSKGRLTEFLKTANEAQIQIPKEILLLCKEKIDAQQTKRSIIRKVFS